MNDAVVRAIALVGSLSLSGCASSAPTEAVAPESVSPTFEPGHALPEIITSVPEAIRSWFLLAGYQPYQAEALVDHARIESRFQPCVVARSGSRYLFQWLGSRLERLWKFADRHGCPPLAAQLAFANEELYHERRYSCFWRARDRRTALAALRRGFGRGHC